MVLTFNHIYNNIPTLKKEKTMPDNKRDPTKDITEAFTRLAELNKQPKDPFDGKHLSVVTLSMWADDEYPKDFLEKYIERHAEHFAECEKCRKNVEFYKDKRRKNGF
jgi:hypothetical protein